jgi:hypothetical protein
MVRVLGDLSGLSKAFNDSATAGQTAAGKMHSAFSGMLGTLNSAGVLGEFGGTLATADSALQSMGNHAKDTSTKMMGLGGVALGIGTALSAMGSKDQAAHQQLQASIATTGHSYETYAGQIDSAIKTQAHFGNSSADTQDALRKLTTATGDPKKALDLLSEASNLAAAKHIDLSSAATQLGKVYNGNTKLLKEFGIAVTAASNPQKELVKATTDHTKAVVAQQQASRQLLELQTADQNSKKLTAVQILKLQDAQNKVKAANLAVMVTTQGLTKAQKDVADAHGAATLAVDQLGRKLAGQASAQANTFTGHMKALRTEITNHVAEWGTKYGPALTKAGAALTGLGGIIKVTQGVMELFRGTQVATTVATEAGTVVQTESTIARIAGNVATGAAVVAMGIATAAQWAWNIAMEANPIVLIVTLIAVLVAAIVVVIAHFVGWKTIINDVWGFIRVAFNDIWGAIKTVFDWIAANWPLLAAILAGPIGLAVYLIATNWHHIIDGLQDVMSWISGHAADLWNPLLDAAKAVWNAIARGWNDTIGSLNFTVPSWVPFLGGHSFGFPKIPTLQQGGYVQQTGLALVHEGETVTPANKRPGPVVHIEHAHFADTLDVDLFMKRVAWAAATRVV